MRISNIEQLYQHFLEYPNVCTDSRQLKKNDIFFSLKGDNFNGNLYASHALEMGASYVIVDENINEESDRVITVDNVLETLQQLATHHRLQSKAKILAITGTNGKTTTKELIAQVLKTRFNIIFTEGNLNNHIGVPLTLLRIKNDTEIAIIEMGANHIGEIASYCQWAQPDMGLITNIGKAHLEGFGGLEGVKIAKGELYNYLSHHHGAIFRYADDRNLYEIGHTLPNTTTYGSSKTDVVGKPLFTSQFAQVDVTHPSDLAQVYTSQLIGAYNAPNILCAIAIGHHFGIEKSVIAAAIESYSPNNARSQFLQKGSNNIILDAYNANPTSMAAAIDNFDRLQEDNKIICIGGMKELGDESLEEHQIIVDLISQKQFQKVYLVGKEFLPTTHSFDYFEDSLSLMNHLSSLNLQSATLLIKGSRGSKMEVLLQAFEQ